MPIRDSHAAPDLGEDFSPRRSAEKLDWSDGATRYIVDGEIARGGVGIIYKAYDRVRCCHVALKRPSADHSADVMKNNAETLEREYSTLASIKHPRVVSVYEYGVDQTGPYYTMELLEGTDLKAAAPVPWRDLCSYMRDIASSLGLLHARRLLHRDISPLNVRIVHGRAKLIDFGALTPFGTPSELVGSVGFIAPEALANGELDQRLDIYSLGATAYYALTGALAYPATSLDELPRVWRSRALVPVTRRATDVPRELEALVTSMLSLDPSARPMSAADVIDKVTTIAALAPEDEQQLLIAYLRAPELVGRDELRSMAASELRARQHGQSRLVIVEGAHGMGKSAMLEDICHQARVQGALVLSTLGSAHHGVAFSTCNSLWEQALTEAPELAARAMASHGFSWSIRSRKLTLGGRSTPDDSIDAGVRAAYVGMFAELAHERTLVISVDDAEKADSLSTLLLSELAQTPTRSLIAFSASPDPAGLQVTLRPARRIAARLSLQLLSDADVEALVRSWFGSRPAAKRLSVWLAKRSGGNPLLCIEQAAELVRHKRLRYIGGAWELPREFPDSKMLDHKAAFEQRIEVLGADALRLATSLSAQRSAIAEDDARALGLADASLSASQFEACLSELQRERVIVRSAGQIAFVADDLRCMLYARLEQSRRPAVHRRFAELLAPAVASDPSREGEAAYHLLAAGDEVAASVFLRSAVSLCTRHGDLVAKMVPDFVAIDAEYERMGVSREERLLATLPLVVSGWYADPSLTHDMFGEEVARRLYHATGMDVATRFQKRMGALFAFLTGLLVGLVRYLSLRKKRRFARWLDYPVAFYGACASLSAVAALRNARHVHVYLLELLAHAKNLRRRQSARLVYEIVATGPLFTNGRIALGVAKLRRTLADLSHVVDIDAGTRSQIECGVRFYIGRLVALQASREALEHAAALDRAGSVHESILAEFIRFTYFAHRGELDRATQARQRFDELAAQFGGSWSADLLAALDLGHVHLNADVVGIKEHLQQLELAIAKHPEIALVRDVARAMYEGHRGNFAVAVAMYEGMGSRIAPFTTPIWSHAYAHWAQCLNALGRHAESLSLCRTASNTLGSEDRVYVVLYQQLQHEEAAALSGLGETGAAAALLDTLGSQQSTHDQPLLSFLLHCARARVAWQSRDDETFRVHIAAAQGKLGSMSSARAAELQALSRLASSSINAPNKHGVAALSVPPELNQPDQPVAVVAQRVAEHAASVAGATSARVYLIDAARYALAGSFGHAEWPADLAARVDELVQSSMGHRTVAATHQSAGRDSAAILIPLQLLNDDDDDVRTVAVLALSGNAHLSAPKDSHLEQYARALARAVEVHF